MGCERLSYCSLTLRQVHSCVEKSVEAQVVSKANHGKLCRFVRREARCLFLLIAVTCVKLTQFLTCAKKNQWVLDLGLIFTPFFKFMLVILEIGQTWFIKPKIDQVELFFTPKSRKLRIF